MNMGNIILQLHIGTCFRKHIVISEVELHTNTIEGTWDHAKFHFKRVFGTKGTNLLTHLCKIKRPLYRLSCEIKNLSMSHSLLS